MNNDPYGDPLTQSETRAKIFAVIFMATIAVMMSGYFAIKASIKSKEARLQKTVATQPAISTNQK